MRRYLFTCPAILVIALAILSGPVSSGGALECGEWRWGVKTLSDPDASKVDFDAKRMNVRELLELSPPGSLSSDTPRLDGIEFETIKIRARLITASLSANHDVHLVISTKTRPYNRMIVEFPHPDCPGASKSFHRDAMVRARRQILRECESIEHSFEPLEGKATITGVGFFDSVHGQRGVAPNGIELHPALRFRGDCRMKS
ncbi:MAG: hypothetical protein WD757_00825 [Actinomycetota bacterium]